MFIHNNFLYFCPLKSKDYSMRKKILVLDDKIAIAKVLSIYLASDYDCIWLPNGIEGVKWLQEGNIPDLIISDLVCRLLLEKKKNLHNKHEIFHRCQAAAWAWCKPKVRTMGDRWTPVDAV